VDTKFQAGFCFDLDFVEKRRRSNTCLRRFENPQVLLVWQLRLLVIRHGHFSGLQRRCEDLQGRLACLQKARVTLQRHFSRLQTRRAGCGDILKTCKDPVQVFKVILLMNNGFVKGFRDARKRCKDLLLLDKHPRKVSEPFCKLTQTLCKQAKSPGLAARSGI
jgi:hypothetical protein